jgi:hypothetical protein
MAGLDASGLGRREVGKENQRQEKISGCASSSSPEGRVFCACVYVSMRISNAKEKGKREWDGD